MFSSFPDLHWSAIYNNKPISQSAKSPASHPERAVSWLLAINRIFPLELHIRCLITIQMWWLQEVLLIG